MPERPSPKELRQPFIGRWRITSADCFDRDYLDLIGPAHVLIPETGNGDIEFGAMTATLEIWVSPGMLLFDWNGSDEGDQVSGDGCFEMSGPDTGCVEFEWDSGDRAEFTVVRLV